MLVRVLFKPNKIIDKNKKYYLKYIDSINYDRPTVGRTGTTLRETVNVYLTETKPVVGDRSAFHPRVLMSEISRGIWGWMNPALSNATHYDASPVSAMFTIPKDTPMHVEQIGDVTIITIRMGPIASIDININRTRKNLRELSANAERRAAAAEAVVAAAVANRERAEADAREGAGAGAGAGTPLAPKFGNANTTAGFSLPPIVNEKYFNKYRGSAFTEGDFNAENRAATGGRRRTARHKRRRTARHKRRHTRRH